MLNLVQFLTISGAVVHPEVNGIWKKEDDKIVYKHLTASLFLHADTRNNGNWHITPAIDGGKGLYWARKSQIFPLQEGKFFIGGTNPPEQSKLVITLGNSNGKNV